MRLPSHTPLQRYLRHAALALYRNPGFSASTIAVMALGIGSVSAVFSVVNKVLLEPLPYPDPDRLVQLITNSATGQQRVASIPQFLVWRDTTQSFACIAASGIDGPPVHFSTGGRFAIWKAARVSADYFRLFGARLALGRTFSPSEDKPSGPAAVIISDHLWRRQFASSQQVTGQTILLDQVPAQIIGVLAPDAQLEAPADLWLPLRADPASTDHIGRVRAIARLKEGVSLDQARQDVSASLQSFLGRYPPYTASEAPLLFGEAFDAIPLREAVVGDVKPSLYVLAGAVCFVLAISCANACSLLLVRASRRNRELAIRMALGAARHEILSQMVFENVLLALAGGALGLAGGYFGVLGLLSISPGDLPRIGANGSGFSLNAAVFLFTWICSLAVGVLCGLAPAWKASRAEITCW